ncbi:MAG TPA: permease prefix domain 1-containing protein [Chloroflexota bacterium]
MARDTIEQWGQSLRVSRRRRRTIVMELRSHLQESQQELELAGWKPDDAARESLRRLGDPLEIVESFEEVYRPSRRKQLGLAFALATGMLLGVYGIGGSLASATSTPAHHKAPTTQLHAKVPAPLHHSQASG